jgi:competence protein CoiA
MSNLAVTKEGRAVFADEYSEAQWEILKTYTVGDLLMPCCMSPAIPKTSSNFLQFFAHYSDECNSSPESIWHLKTKEDICSILKHKNIPVELERTGQSSNGKWKADVYFEVEGRRIAIEVQKSYQHFTKYLERQKRYVDADVDSYWLLYKPRYNTLIKSLGKYRLKKDYGGKFPPEGYISPCLPELPIAYYETEAEECSVKGACFFKSTLAQWIDSLVKNNFQCVENIWKIK